MARGEDVYGSMGSVPQMTSVDGSGLQSMDIHASPEAYGAGIGKAVEGAGQAGTELVNKYQEMDAQSKADRDYANVYVPGVVKLRGQFDQERLVDPDGAYKNYMSGLQDLQKDYVSGQQSMYGQKIAESQSIRHIASEVDSVGREVSQSIIDNSADSRLNAMSANAELVARTSYNNPQQINQSIDSANGHFTMMADNNGHDISHPAVQSSIQSATDQYAGNLAGQCIAEASKRGDVQSACNTLASYPQIPPDQQRWWDKVLYQQTSQKQADAAMNLMPMGHPVPVRVGAVPLPLQSRIANACQASNVDPSTCLMAADIESSIGQNPNATTLFQVKGQRGGTTTDQQINAGIGKLQQAQIDAKNALGRDPEPWETYLCFQQGSGGGPAILKSLQENPNQNAIQALSGLYKNRQDAVTAITANGGNATMSVSDFAGHWQQLATQKYNTNRIDGNVAKDGQSLGDAIIAPHNQTGPVMQPAANPREKLGNWNKVFPSIQSQIMAITNVMDRDVMLKSLDRRDKQLRDASERYTQSIIMDGMNQAMKPGFDISQLPPQTKASILELQDGAAKLDKMEKIASEQNPTITKNGRDVYMRLLQPDDPNGIKDQSELYKTLSKPHDAGGTSKADFNAANPALGLDPKAKTVIYNRMKDLEALDPDLDGKAWERSYNWAINATKMALDNQSDPKQLMSTLKDISKEPVGFNYVTRAQQLRTAAAQLSKPQQQATNQDRVTVMNQDGQMGTIPANQLDEAIKSGFKKVE